MIEILAVIVGALLQPILEGLFIGIMEELSALLAV